MVSANYCAKTNTKLAIAKTNVVALQLLLHFTHLSSKKQERNIFIKWLSAHGVRNIIKLGECLFKTDCLLEYFSSLPTPQIMADPLPFIRHTCWFAGVELLQLGSIFLLLWMYSPRNFVLCVILILKDNSNLMKGIYRMERNYCHNWYKNKYVHE